MSKILSRRKFIAGSAVLIGGVSSVYTRFRRGVPAAPRGVVLGKDSDFGSGDTMLELYRVLVRRDRDVRGRERLRALSLVCTHQNCLLKKTEGGFECPCHQSQFDNNGSVMQGPANEPLRWLRLSRESGAIVVYPTVQVASADCIWL